jgi:hypothetical protein
MHHQGLLPWYQNLYAWELALRAREQALQPPPPDRILTLDDEP